MLLTLITALSLQVNAAVTAALPVADSSLNTSFAQTYDGSSAYDREAEVQLLDMANAERAHVGLAPLKMDEGLVRAARAHAAQMASQNKLSHQFSGELDLSQRIGATGARISAAAENVAMAGYPEDAHLALMNSPGHRANILNPKYNVAGIAVAKVGKQLYVTEDFAHAVRTYTEEEFRDAIVAGFNALRRAHNLAPIDARADSGLDHQACSGHTHAGELLPGPNQASRAVSFTASEPAQLPAPVEEAASDISLRHMNVGVCYQPDPDTKFARFWVIMTFSQLK